MSPWSSGRVRSRLLRVVGLVSVGALLGGCTYADEEPGLLVHTPASTSASPPGTTGHRRVPATNPALPVLGEEVLTSADGLGVQVRIAVHAIRRISGATVLDWSVTPLTAPNLLPGDPVPPTLDLGLSRPDDERPRIDLLDSRGGRLYRPLAGPRRRPGCICTPWSVAQRRLRIGHTTLLQVAFPALPSSESTIDLVIATVPPFWQVPVTRADHIPTAVQPTELARPSDAASISGGRSDMFRYGPGEQIFRIELSRVLASDTFSALEWTIRSVTGGAGLESASSPPFAEPNAARVESASPVAASGPILVVGTQQGTRSLRARLVSPQDTGARGRECLCSSLQGWTSVLRRPDKAVTVVTIYPPLPAGTRRAQVRFAGLGHFSVEVTPAPSARSRAGEARLWTPATWPPAAGRPTPTWASEDWPTPVPSADQQPDWKAEPYALVR